MLGEGHIARWRRKGGRLDDAPVFYLWYLLSWMTQRPLLAAVVVLAIWFAADRAWVRRSSPFRWAQRRQEIARLRQRLGINPHDRDARFNLAEALVETGQHDEAAALLEKNLAAGDDDVETLWLAGKAVYGSARPDGGELGEAFFAKAKEKQPSFRSGAIDLELGRGRLGRDRHAAAVEALKRAIESRPGSIEAHVLLARAHAGAGRAADADAARQKAWQLYRDAPRFKRRQDRGWAWKAKPIAAVRYYASVAFTVGAVVLVLPRLWPTAEMDIGASLADVPEEGWNVEIRDVPAASRFDVAVTGARPTGEPILLRWDLNENGEVDLRRKIMVGDLWCRMLTHYPELAEDTLAYMFLVEDTQTGAKIGVAPQALSYVPLGPKTERWRESVIAFEVLLESVPPQDCEAEIDEEGPVVVLGVEDGVPFQRTRW